MISRRGLLRAGAAVGTGFLLPDVLRQQAHADTYLLLPPPPPGQRFVNLLPLPRRVDAPLLGRLQVQMEELQQWLGLTSPSGSKLMTTVWGYGLRGQKASYPGPTLEAFKNVPLLVEWRNTLPRPLLPFPRAHPLPVDTSIHLARPRFGVPTVTHLHGGHTEPESDGLPEAWFTQRYLERGPDWRKQLYRYDNTQEAGTLWYHDHTLGITRLNVYAGLAGFYLLRDENEQWLMPFNVLPSGPYEIVLAIQDRMFTDQGQLFYPATPPPDTTAPFPSVLPEFFGDFILVNGMAWPRLEVEPRQYRLRMLNGSDSRFYRLFFNQDMRGRVFQVGTELGLLDHPVPLDEPFILAPGERRDLVIDFKGLEGARLTLHNDAPVPFPAGDPLAAEDPTRDIMRFDVSLPLRGHPWPSSEVRKALPGGIPGTLRPKHGPLQPLTATRERKVLLFEGTDRFGRIRLLLGGQVQPQRLETLLWDEPITEDPVLGAVEVWEIYNVTADAHPIHLHMVHFQVLGRAPLTVAEGAVTPKEHFDPHTGESEGMGGILDLTQVFVEGFQPPPPDEQGWKDTVQAFPGEVTRIVARFDRPGRYAWHCHILSHEDHEMMRPYQVVG
ncbi:multicopper oxidase domain-containing protein [Cystobacter fuscus]|nr:multicopper oxidase domain-containing protein [Cystobacter fuscus]